ncbi:hypothetical protein SANTM175S_01371 [Streptomyces antimycoticus]
MDEVRAASMAGVRTQSVLVVLFDGVQPLDIAGPVDVFSVAARYTGSEGTPPYVVRTASLGGATVRSAGGLRLVPDLDLADAENPDILLVPGGPGMGDVGSGLVTWLRQRGPDVRACRISVHRGTSAGAGRAARRPPGHDALGSL